MQVFVLSVLVAFLHRVDGYSKGAPQESYRACQIMMPGHGYNSQSLETAPASLVVTGSPRNKGKMMRLKLVANEGETFRGFLIQGKLNVKLM